MGVYLTKKCKIVSAGNYLRLIAEKVKALVKVEDSSSNMGIPYHFYCALTSFLEKIFSPVY